MITRWSHLAAVALVAVVAAAPAHASDFLKAIDDVPLVRGMTETGEPIVFESDQGRVVQTAAEGQVVATEISSFYIASLPALGWKRIEAAETLSFERENERLNISIREPASSRPVVARFELVVRLASTRLPE